MFKVVSQMVLALVMSMGSALATAEQRHTIDPALVWVDSPVDKAVCDQVSQISYGVKVMFDNGFSNKEISDKMIEIGQANLKDSSGWTAVTMMATLKNIDTMRGWVKRDNYKLLKQKLPSLTDAELYQAYAGGICDGLQGTTVKTLKVSAVSVY